MLDANGLDKIHCDFETGSPADLRKTGVYRYAEHPGTRVHVLKYCLSDTGPMQTWRPGEPDPTDLLEMVAAGRTVAAHNAAFERVMWNWHLRVRVVPHWPELKIGQMDCTMSRANALGIPASLDAAGHILGADVTKQKEGRAVMLKCAKPRKVAKCIRCDGTGRHGHNNGPCDVCGGVGEVYSWWI